MSIGGSESKIWQEIERSESYLVCSMFEEAASLASSLVKQLLCRVDDGTIQVYDMLQSAGMVLVQSLHHLRRASQILDELNQSFSSVESIPVQVILTGACFQMLESPSGVAEFLEEFLSKWRFAGRNCYVLAGVEVDMAYVEGCDERFVLGVDKYLEVVEVYVMKLLATTLKDMDLAISWIEKAELPEDTRQGLLRRLHFLHSVKATNLSEPLFADNHEALSSSLKELNMFEGSPPVSDGNHGPNEEKSGKQQAVLRLSKRVEPCFWWFRTINLKFGSARVVISNTKLVIGCLFLFLYWILRRKRASLKRIVEKQALNVKKAVVDLWQLAFSYQMNPLAAVQSPAARGSV